MENRGLLAGKRALITILDRAALMEMAKGIYGQAEAQSIVLIPIRKHSPSSPKVMG